MKTDKNRAQGSLEYMMMIAIALTVIIGAAVLINQLMSSMKIKTEADADLNRLLSSNDPSKMTKAMEHMQKYFAVRRDQTVNFGSVSFEDVTLDMKFLRISTPAYNGHSTIKDNPCIKMVQCLDNEDHTIDCNGETAVDNFKLLADTNGVLVALKVDCMNAATFKVRCGSLGSGADVFKECTLTLEGVS